MDERLIAAHPRDVARIMASEYLATPDVAENLGEIHLAAHQVDAAARILSTLDEANGAVLADATGLGKTFVAIAVARMHASTMVVAPAAIRGMWRDALRRTGVGASITTYEAMSRGYVHAGDRPALLVLDEAHHARNPRSRRFAALAELAWGARVLVLTATPIHNKGRDLRALLSLFLGSRALTLNDDDASRFIVRRTLPGRRGPGAPILPKLVAPQWLPVPSDRRTLAAITSLPEPVPTVDGTVAHALLVLGLIRAWASSEAALRSTLRRRLLRATAMTASLESGQLPHRKDLTSWLIVDSAVQLGFPNLFPATGARVDIGALRASLERHCDGVRAILRSLDESGGVADVTRSNLLTSIRARHPKAPVVAFSQFADTAHALFRACVSSGGVALVSGRGAQVASGRIATDEVVRAFDISDASARPRALPFDLLIATDVLSEGLSLRRAGAIVHLDLPWTIARLEQRVGRLRRIGSPHARIDVYAIGPPVASRELTAVVRALHRKARLSSSLVGRGALEEAMPLLGQRLAHASAAIGRNSEAEAAEELRLALSSWESGVVSAATGHQRNGAAGGLTALALVGAGSRRRLVAIQHEQVTTSRSDVLRAVQALSRYLTSEEAGADVASLERVVAAVTQWLERERGRTIAQPATDAPSPAHANTLRELQAVMAMADRTRRGRVAEQVVRCRELVLASRGMGAELAMERLLAMKARSAFDLDALEALLAHRVPPRSPGFASTAGTIEAVLVRPERPGGGTSALVAPPVLRRQSTAGTAAHAVPVTRRTTRQAASL